jgi:hypothetical protein
MSSYDDILLIHGSLETVKGARSMLVCNYGANSNPIQCDAAEGDERRL